MVRLVPMTSEEYRRFIARSIAGYAEANVAAGAWTAAEAPDRSRGEFDRLLPSGLATPDHFLFSIRDGGTNDRVGELWFAIRHPPMPPGGFVYDLFIDPSFRRCGYGKAALEELEGFARAHGINEIGLHVFGYNRPAIDLYTKLGYETTNLLMRKRLGAPEARGNAQA